MCGWRPMLANRIQDLREALVEGIRVGRPADGLEAIPERLRVVRVVEQEGIAEVAELATGHRVDARPRARADG